MKIAPPESQEQLEELRNRLRCGLPAKPGTYWDVMIYKCRWGWVARAQLRKEKTGAIKCAGQASSSSSGFRMTNDECQMTKE